MKSPELLLFVLFFASSPLSGTVLENPGFEAESLSPWHIDREFGSNRGWRRSGLAPHSGTWSAFSLGRVELRQDFAPILGSQILRFSFFANHQFPDEGNPWVEVFYSEGIGSGLIEIELDPDRSWKSQGNRWVWDEFSLLNQIDVDREVSGFSIVGIPNNVLGIDTVTLVTVPEPASFIFLLIGSSLTLADRKRANKTQHHKSDPAGDWGG